MSSTGLLVPIPAPAGANQHNVCSLERQKLLLLLFWKSESFAPSLRMREGMPLLWKLPERMPFQRPGFGDCYSPWLMPPRSSFKASSPVSSVLSLSPL